MKRTVAEIAEVLGVDVEVARGFIRFLSVTSPPNATCHGERPSTNGKGPAVYSIDPKAPQRIGAMLRRLT